LPAQAHCTYQKSKGTGIVNRPLSQTEHQLGEHRATYLPTVLPGKIMLGTGLASLLISLLPFSIAIEKASTEYTVLSDRFRRDSIAINTTISVVLLLLAVILFALYYHHKKRRVDVYADGFIFADWRRSLVVHWNAVSELYASPVVRQTSRGYRSDRIVNWIYTIHTNTGEKARLGGLTGIGELGATIQARVLKRLLPRAIAAYQAGDDVPFGPRLGLSQQGVRVGDRTLPWSDVAKVDLSRDNGVTIRQTGRRMPWKRVNGHKVANPMVLKALLSRFGRRQQY
jgi:hypothetical protein